MAAPKTSRPFVIITEQPTSKPIRYRYKCEGRSASTIPGELSTSENKTYPSIKIVGYQGNAKVIVSCVTKDEPYRPHPHSLVGREGCKNGVCALDIPSTTSSITFTNLGVQCARRKDVVQVLEKRQNEVGIDPFNTGFNHKHNPALLDMNVLRLCFQVFIEDNNGDCTIPLKSVVSDPVYDRKAVASLEICRLSDCVSPVDGGKKDIYLLCKKVAKDNIKVRFYEGDAENPTWEGFPDIQPTQIHEQTTIWFKAPPYKNIDIVKPAKVHLQLLRPSDGFTSEPYPFQYLPTDAEPGMLKRKRQKFGNDPRRNILLNLQEQLKETTVNYNIPGPVENFNMLDMNVDRIGIPVNNPSEFVFTASPATPNLHLTLPDNDKILNTMSIDTYTSNYIQNTDVATFQYQSFRETTSTTPIYSPAYENISSPIHDNFTGSVDQEQFSYLNTTESPVVQNQFNNVHTSAATTLPGNAITDKEKVKNAIRAKCKSMKMRSNATNGYNSSAMANQLNNETTEDCVSMVLQQNNLKEMCANSENFNSLLDVDFEQLDNLLLPSYDGQYNLLNIPMNAMTLSETSCNLSSLLNMDTSQIQSTISTEQLENLLAII